MASAFQAPSNYAPTFGGGSASAQSLDGLSPLQAVNTDSGGRGAKRRAVPVQSQVTPTTPGRSPPADLLSPPTTDSWTIEIEGGGSGKNSNSVLGSCVKISDVHSGGVGSGSGISGNWIDDHSWPTAGADSGMADGLSAKNLRAATSEIT